MTRTDRSLLARILADPTARRELFVRSIVAIQDREGITTSRHQAEHAYDAVQRERASRGRP